MPTADPSGSQQTNLFAALMGATNFPAMACPVTINSQDVEVLLDSGSMITLVHNSLVNPAEISQENTIPVSCVYGDTQKYPTTALTLITTKGKRDVKAGVVNMLPVSVLSGRYCPIFHVLWQDILGKKMRETQRPKGKFKRKGDTPQDNQDVKYDQMLFSSSDSCRNKGCSRGD